MLELTRHGFHGLGEAPAILGGEGIEAPLEVVQGLLRACEVAPAQCFEELASRVVVERRRRRLRQAILEHALGQFGAAGFVVEAAGDLLGGVGGLGQRLVGIRRAVSQALLDLVEHGQFVRRGRIVELWVLDRLGDEGADLLDARYRLLAGLGSHRRV